LQDLIVNCHASRPSPRRPTLMPSPAFASIMAAISKLPQPSSATAPTVSSSPSPTPAKPPMAATSQLPSSSASKQTTFSSSAPKQISSLSPTHAKSSSSALQTSGSALQTPVVSSTPRKSKRRPWVPKHILRARQREKRHLRQVRRREAKPRPKPTNRPTVSAATVSAAAVSDIAAPTSQTSSSAAPQTSSSAVPQTSSSAVPQTSSSAVPQTSSSAVPQTSSPAVPQTSSSAVPQISSSLPPKTRQDITPTQDKTHKTREVYIGQKKSRQQWHPPRWLRDAMDDLDFCLLESQRLAHLRDHLPASIPKEVLNEPLCVSVAALYVSVQKCCNRLRLPDPYSTDWRLWYPWE
jgi:hypothetical protein